MKGHTLTNGVCTSLRAPAEDVLSHDSEPIRLLAVRFLGLATLTDSVVSADSVRALREAHATDPSKAVRALAALALGDLTVTFGAAVDASLPRLGAEDRGGAAAQLGAALAAMLEGGGEGEKPASSSGASSRSRGSAGASKGGKGASNTAAATGPDDRDEERAAAAETLARVLVAQGYPPSRAASARRAPGPLLDSPAAHLSAMLRLAVSADPHAFPRLARVLGAFLPAFAGASAAHRAVLYDAQRLALKADRAEKHLPKLATLVRELNLVGAAASAEGTAAESHAARHPSREKRCPALPCGTGSTRNAAALRPAASVLSRGASSGSPLCCVAGEPAGGARRRGRQRPHGGEQGVHRGARARRRLRPAAPARAGGLRGGAQGAAAGAARRDAGGAGGCRGQGCGQGDRLAHI